MPGTPGPRPGRRRPRGAPPVIISRYLVRALSRPLLATLGTLVALFASYSAGVFLADAVAGLMPLDAVAALIGLKVLISLEVLIPASLYISVMLSFAKLGGESEFVAMFALRMTPATMARAVLMLSGCLALAVAGLSLVVRPWAYQRLHALTDQAAALLDVDAMAAGSFYVGQHGARVIFLGARDGEGSPARDVFIRVRHHDRTEIISARGADAVPRADGRAGSEVYLRDAHIYETDRDDGRPDEALEARGIVVNPGGRDPDPPGYSAVAASTAHLLASRSPEDVAELQWRLSTPLSTLLLGLMGIPLSRSRPRQGRGSKLGAAFFVYFGYYLLCTSARTWVQHGAIGRFPGIWWAPALLGAFLLATTCRPRLGRAGR